MEIYVMPICKFCGQDKKLCNAHIIPKSFVYAAKPEDKTEKLKVLNYNLKYPSFSRIGITDRNILCSQCDGEFGVYDNFAYNFLIKTNISQYLTAIEGVNVYDIPLKDKEAELLALFFISVLYRMSISQCDMCRNLSLGSKYENLAKDILQKKINWENKGFDIYIFKEISSDKDFNEKINYAITYPLISKTDGINHYSFILNGYRCVIKVDQRSFPDTLDQLKLTNKRIKITEITFEKTNDFVALQKLALHFKK